MKRIMRCMDSLILKPRDPAWIHCTNLPSTRGAWPAYVEVGFWQSRPLCNKVRRLEVSGLMWEKWKGQVSPSLHHILQNRTEGPWLKMRNLFHHPFTPSFIQPACLALGVLLSQRQVGRQPEFRVSHTESQEGDCDPNQGRQRPPGEERWRPAERPSAPSGGRGRRPGKADTQIASDAVWWERQEKHEQTVWRKRKEETQNIHRGRKEPSECADTTGKPSFMPECTGNGRKQTGEGREAEGEVRNRAQSRALPSLEVKMRRR